MTENKKLKRKLIVQSFLPLSILIVIKSVTKETLGKIYCLLDSILHKCNIIETIQETGLRDDIWQILIGIIALWFAIVLLPFGRRPSFFFAKQNAHPAAK